MGLSSRARTIGALAAVVGVLGFSIKAILIKLAYARYAIDPLTLLALRMLYAAPFFVAMAWWAGRTRTGRRFTRRDWASLVALGFVGYYLASLLDFLGLAYISAALERLILFLYPTFVVLLSALLHRQAITRRIVVALVLSYAGIALVFAEDLAGATDRAGLWTGALLILGSAAAYAVYLVQAGPLITRLGSARFAAWAMLASTGFVLAHFTAARSFGQLAVPSAVQWLALAMAVLSTVLPTWLVAESIKRIGANASSLVGSLGPVFTIGLGAAILGETVRPLQLAGAALVLVGVMLVTLRSAVAGGVSSARTPATATHRRWA